VCCELPECYLADIPALLKLNHILVDGIVKADLALPNGEGQQCCVENFAKRSEIEQRIRSEWTFRPLIGHASVKNSVRPLPQMATAAPPGSFGQFASSWATIFSTLLSPPGEPACAEPVIRAVINAPHASLIVFMCRGSCANARIAAGTGRPD
jgi:hypothetical protein